MTVKTLTNFVKLPPFESAALSIKKKKKKQLAAWSLEAPMRGMFQAHFNVIQQPAQTPLPTSPTSIVPTNLNEMCCCVNSRRQWPLSPSKHLSETGWNCCNPGCGIITPAWDRHETPSVFILPISLGLSVLSSCFLDSASLFFQHCLIYLVSLVELDRLPPEIEPSLWRLIIEAHWRATLLALTCARKCKYALTHTQTDRGHHIVL